MATEVCPCPSDVGAPRTLAAIVAEDPKTGGFDVDLLTSLVHDPMVTLGRGGPTATPATRWAAASAISGSAIEVAHTKVTRHLDGGDLDGQWLASYLAKSRAIAALIACAPATWAALTCAADRTAS